MPNLKMHVDDSLLPDLGPRLRAALPDLRALLCAHMKVTPDQCQMAMIAVAGLPDQPPINIEFAYLPKPDRPPELVAALARDLRAALAPLTDARVAVRAAALDPATYLTLK